MPTYNTVEERGFAAISLEGSSEVLEDASIALRLAGFQVDSIGRNSILLKDVREGMVDDLETVAQEFNLKPIGAYGKKTFIDRQLVKATKPLLLPLQPEKWYFSEVNKESYPFVRIRDVRIEKTGQNGDADQIIRLDMYSASHEMPQSYELSAKDVAQMQLREATEDDFINMDMIVPSREDMVLPVQPSHGIPDPNLDPSINQPVETLQPNPMRMQHWD